MITQDEYQARRKKLAQQLPADSIAIIPAANEVHRNGDAHYRFRQDSNFYYLTGFDEPNALLIITTGKEDRSILFNRSRNPLEEQLKIKIEICNLLLANGINRKHCKLSCACCFIFFIVEQGA